MRGSRRLALLALLVNALVLCLPAGADGEKQHSDGTGRSRALESPVYVPWNGFLGMSNVLELVNTGSEAITVTVGLYNLQGVEAGGVTVSVEATSQRDVILNELNGFTADSYGIVKLTFVSQTLSGRLSFYRIAPDYTSYDFAFSVPFQKALSGRTAVSFNTYQPSLNPLEAADQVFQWLSIVNLDEASERGFTVKSFNRGGTLISQREVRLAPLTRVDLEGGHATLGPGNVGLHVIEPADNDTTYLAQLVRYGQGSATSSIREDAKYAFAFPLLARAGLGTEQWVGISNGADGANWLELINAGSTPEAVSLEFYDNQGTNAQSITVELAPYAQQHIYASALLGVGQSGGVQIVPASTSAQILAQSMFYFRDALGRIEAMYGSQASEVKTEPRVGTYNLYLGMYNWLRVFNTTSASKSIGVTVVAPSGRAKTHLATLGPYSGQDFGLHQSDLFGTSPDSYGIVSLSSSVLAEVIRLRPDASGGTDFAFPTQLVDASLLLEENSYYVSAATGDDSGPGTLESPWKTIGHAARTLSAGETVYIRAGTYAEQVRPANSGSAGQYIEYTAYPGDAVTIDGSSISLPEGQSGLFEVIDKSYILVSGLRVINAGPDDNSAGIFVDNSNNIIIENNYTYNTVSSGIGVWNSSYVTIDGNEVELACNDGEQECITVAVTDNFIVKNNHVHDNGAGTIGGEGIDIKDGSTNGSVYGNRVHDLNNRLGIYIEAWDKYTHDIEVYNNTVYNVSSADGFAVGSERGGLLENIRVYNNLAYNNGCSGLSVSVGDEYADVPSHPLKDIYVLNNTFYNNGSNSCYGSRWGGGISVDNPDIDNVIIRNNICADNLVYQIAVEDNVPLGELSIDHNLIHLFRGEVDEETRGSPYVEGDPQFVSPTGGNFRLGASSPAVDRGSSNEAPSVDFDSTARPQGLGVDIGAFELQQTTAQPALNRVSTWAYQLQNVDFPGAVDTLAQSNYDLLVLEPTRTDWSSDNREFDTKAVVSRLKASQGQDAQTRKLVLAYIDIGEAEDWRWYWTWSKDWSEGQPKPADWPEYILTHDPDGWEGNYPVAYWNENWKDIIIYGRNQNSSPWGDYSSALDEAIGDGFDGVYLDWVEGYENEAVVRAAEASGRDAADEMVKFIREIKTYCRARNPEFLIIQQNAAELAKERPEILSLVDAVSQEAVWFDGTGGDIWEDPDGHDVTQSASLSQYYISHLNRYLQAGLPVFNCEYAVQNAASAYQRSLAAGYVPYVTRRSLSALSTTPPPST